MELILDRTLEPVTPLSKYEEQPELNAILEATIVPGKPNDWGMMEKELTIKEYGGQKCDLKLFKRKDGSKYVTFHTVSGYGNHSYTSKELMSIIDELDNI